MQSRTATFSYLRALVVLLLPVFAFSVASAQDGRALWADVSPDQVTPVGERGVEPLAFRALSLDFDGMVEHLASAPVEVRIGDVSAGRLVVLPLPEGDFAMYRVVESPMMPPGLQQRYPDIRTYVGQDVDERRATVRISISPQGFHAIVHRLEGTLYISPFTQFDRHHVRVYWSHDMPERPTPWYDDIIEIDEAEKPDPDEGRDDNGLRFDHGEVLRVYRTAIAAKHEYTAFHSSNPNNPTVEEGLAAIVVAMNRVNSIFERDVAVRFELVENNDLIIYTNAADDPYPHQYASQTNLSTNQQNLNNVIGSANYDVGHLFFRLQQGDGRAGLAALGSACHSTWKARAASGIWDPVDDPFVVDIVAHEFGHQYNAGHSFNGSASNCGSNYWAADSMEPGSGSTIMAYPGICGLHDLQGHADDYLHNISQQRIISFITSGTGSTCPQEFSTENDIPLPILPEQFAIPILTPFVLEGDVEYAGDETTLTFSWEGMSSGPQGPPPGVSGWEDSAPYFRSFPPVEDPIRFFPTRLGAYMVNPVPGPFPHRGEGLPASTRLLPFRMTVRNNAPGGGAVSHRQLTVHVAGSRGPFVVTSHSSAQSFLGEQQTTVTWDVANTNVSSTGGENVDILLSLDRANDILDGIAIVLAEGVPNNGAHTVTIPAGLNANRARFFVKASEGYFFAFSTADLTIHPQVSTEEGTQASAASLSPVYPNPLGVTGSRGVVNVEVDRSQTVRVVVFDALGREVVVLHDGPMAAGVNHQLTIRPRSLAAGTYYVRATGDDFTLVSPMSVVR